MMSFFVELFVFVSSLESSAIDFDYTHKETFNKLFTAKNSKTLRTINTRKRRKLQNHSKSKKKLTITINLLGLKCQNK